MPTARKSSKPSSPWHPDEKPFEFHKRLRQAAEDNDMPKFSMLLDAWKEHPESIVNDLGWVMILPGEDGKSHPLPPRMLKRLMACVKDAIKPTKDLREILYCVVRSGSVENLRILQSHGARLVPSHDLGSPLLHVAIESNRLEMLRYLIDQGLDVETQDIFGRTALFGAVGMPGRAKIQQFLVRKGADVHAVDSDGRTMLHRVIRSGQYVQKEKARTATVRRLLDWGVDPLRRAQYQLSAFDVARNCENAEIRAMIEAHVLAGKSAAPASRRRLSRL